MNIRKLFGLPIHPFLFALYPVTALLAANLSEVLFNDAWRALLTAVLIALLLYVFIFLLTRSLARAAFVTSGLVILFFSYGQIYSVLKMVEVGGMLVGRHRLLVPLWTLLAFILIWIAWRRKELVLGLTSPLNVVATLAFLMPALSYVNYQIVEWNAARALSGSAYQNLESGNLTLDPDQAAPDVYYIILDGYGREDVMRRHFGHNNEPFINSLEALGFVVADESTSNYMQTAASVTSALNMNYLPSVRPFPDPERYPQSFYEPLKNSLVRRELEALGYQTVAFPTGWFATELYDATYFLSPDLSRFEQLQAEGAFNAFESMLIYSTAVQILADYDTISSREEGDFIAFRLQHPFSIQAETILSTFDTLKQVPDIPGPKFVFAHIISNHSPYQFDRNGNPVVRMEPFTLAEGDPIKGQETIPLYVDQLVYINSLILNTVEAILASSETAPIIIIQADHGPVGMIDWNNLDERSIAIRSSILNAYYLPESCREDIYPSITPVNSYRLVFNCQFNGQYSMLDDLSYIGNISTSRSFNHPTANELLE